MAVASGVPTGAATAITARDVITLGIIFTGLFSDAFIDICEDKVSKV